MQPTAQPLVILLHGVGQVPAAMAPLGERIAAALPGARIVALPAALPYDLGQDGRAGLQWFSVDGITEGNRPGRIQAALGAFTEAIRAVQHAHGAAPQDTVLAGFSQGAIMALAGCREAWLARHVVAIAGRFAPLPAQWPHPTAVSLVHGSMDGTVPADHSRRAAACLARLGAAVRLDLLPRTVHRLSPALLDAAVRALVDPPPQTMAAAGLVSN
jgi:phospholipase/carboxylesterase